MNTFVIQCEEIYIDDMNRFKNDKLLSKNIVKNDILDAKKNNIKYNEFKNKYRPSGDDTYIKSLWNSIDSYSYDDWIVILDNE
jgi:hypothetical protein